MSLEFKLIDSEEEWNSFVLQFPRYSFVQSWQYQNVLQTLTADLETYGVYKQGKLICLLPIGVIKARRGSYLRLRHGPIMEHHVLNFSEMERIFDFLRDYAKNRKLNFVRVQPMWDSAMSLKRHDFRYAPTHNLDAESTLQLDLVGKSYDEVQKNMRKNTRYYIRKSQKSGVTVIKDNDDFDKFYEILKATASRQNYTTWPEEYFRAIFENFSGEQRSLYFAEIEGERVGIGLFVDFGKYRFYLEGGMLPKYSKHYPAYAIQGQSILDAVEKGQEVYDFWGGVSPKDKNGEAIKDYPWAGIDLFKRGFGGEERKMVHPHDLVVSWKYWPTYAYEWLEKHRRGY